MTKGQLPGSWEIARLNDIVAINPTIDKRSIDDETLVSFVPMPAVEAETGRIDLSTVKPFKEVKKGYTGFLERDVIFAKITPCMENGKMAIVPKLKNDLGFGSTEFHVLRAPEGLSPELLYYYVSSKWFRVEAEHGMTGAVGQRRVPTSFLQSALFPVPPFNEQKRIVAKIEELFSELDNGIAALKTAREQLKVYRQAVLKHAFEGKLTAQWRKDNADKLESPEQLLARIQQEREARYQQQLEEWNAAVKVWEAGAKEGRKPSKPIKPKTLSSVSQEESSKLGDIPDEWRWVRLGNIALIGTGVTPLKSNINFYEGGDIAWVTSGALNDAFVREPSDLITIRALNETNLRLYPPHTLVVALYGEGKTRGKCSELLIEAATNQAVAAIMLDDISSGLRRFVKGFLTKNYEDMRLFASGGVQPNLNLGIIENMAIPLCSVEEANEIAGLLEKKDSEIEHLASEIDRQIAKAVILRQSILKKAFSGQLVPQDPSEEPASELLARIQAERNAKKTSNTRKVK